MQELRGQIDRIDGEVRIPAALQGTPASGRIVRLHGERQMAQEALRDSIAQWSAVRRDRGASDSEIYRRFYHTFAECEYL